DRTAIPHELSKASGCCGVMRNKTGAAGSLSETKTVDPTPVAVDDAGGDTLLSVYRPEAAMRVVAILTVMFGLCLIARGPALADGGGDGGSDRSNPSTCQRGEAWDSRSQRCVKAEKGVLPDEDLTDYAFSLIRAGRYDEALSMLDLLTNPNTPV